MDHDVEVKGSDLTDDDLDNATPWLMGKAAAVVNEKKSAREIVNEFVDGAVFWLREGNAMVVSKSKM